MEELVDETVSSRYSQPTSNQSPDFIVDCVQTLRSFVPSESTFTSPERLALSEAIHSLDSCSWFPAYGCAIVVEPAVYVGWSHLLLVFPDRWETCVQNLCDSPSYVATPTDTTVLELGRVETKSTSAFLASVDSLLMQAQERTGDERTAATGRQGHQKTPSFIHCLVRQALSSTPQVDLLPYGGTTDVGKHTGSNRRATSWPLVCSVLSMLLPSATLFAKFRIDLFLWLGDFMGDFLTKLTPCAIDNTFALMDAATSSILELHELGFDVTEWTKRVEDIRANLDDAYRDFVKNKTEQYKVVQEIKGPSVPAITFPSPQTLSTEPEDKDVVLKRALDNAGSMPPFNVDITTPDAFGQTLAWIRSHARLQNGADADARLLVLHQIEQVMWHHATNLSPLKCGLKFSETQVSAVKNLASEYSTVVGKWLTSEEGKHTMSVIWRSKEMVITWIAFCLIHQDCETQYPLVKNYRTPLPWKELRHVVLPEKKASDAVSLVAAYIRGRSPKNLSLFSIQEHEGTYDFAKHFAAHDKGMLERWEHEKTLLRSQEKRYMDQVRAKQAKVEKLRAQLLNLERKFDEADKVRMEYQDQMDSSRWHEPHIFYPLRDNLQNARWKANDAERAVEKKKSDIQAMLVPPQFVVSPLPKDSVNALICLFFFLFPPKLNTLAELAETSLEMLVARPAVRPTEKYLTISDHYNSFSSSKVQDGHLKILFFDVNPPNLFGPTSVVGLCDPSESFWSPPVESYCIESSTCRSSFEIDPKATESYYTAKVKDYPMLQWAMEYPNSESSKRGNLVFSQLHLKPTGMTKASFLALGTLRSYPHQQYKKLVHGILDKTLPLDNTFVQSLIRQSLYQMGDLSDEDVPLAEWKRGIRETSGIMSLFEALKQTIEDTRETPRAHQSFVLLAEITGYLTQYFASARSLARDLVDIAQSWIVLLQSQMKEKSPDEVMSLRAKECLMCAFAILALDVLSDEPLPADTPATSVFSFGESSRGFGSVPPATKSVLGVVQTSGEFSAPATAPKVADGSPTFSVQDAMSLVKYMVQFQNGFASSFGSELESVLCKMKVHVQLVMCRQISKVMHYLTTNTCRLTEVVQSSFQGPDALAWKRIPNSYCFEADATIRGTYEHYLINVLTGCVLLNGSPPGRMPKQILSHTTYKKYFGEQDFEVVRIVSRGDAIYRTTRRFHGNFYYEFSLRRRPLLPPQRQSLLSLSQFSLRIQEIDSSCNRVLELVEIRQNEWVEEGLPIRLLQMYSAWVDFTDDIIAFRPTSFNERAINYVVKTPPNDPSKFLCHEVPLASQKQEFSTLMNESTPWPYFLNPESTNNVVSVLSRIEAYRFIHVLQAPNNEIWFHLPRFDLTFVGSSLETTTHLRSREYSDYHLARCQHIDHLLPFFDHYIVLERTVHVPGQPIRMILVPDGVIVTDSNHDAARVKLSDSCHTNLNTLAFEECPSTNQLVAKTILGRLHLAAILAASSTSLPDPHLKMTGTEAALAMFRQCWVTRPLTPSENAKLTNLSTFAFKEPALAVLCEQLRFESQQRAFLFNVVQSVGQTSTSPYSRLLASQSELRAMMTSSKPWNSLRRGLSLDERQKCMPRVPHPRGRACQKGMNAVDSLPPHPVDDNVVSTFETDLLAIVQQNTTSANEIEPYPLHDDDTTSVGMQVIAALKSSWMHHQQSNTSVVLDIDAIVAQVSSISSDVDASLQRMTSYLCDMLEQTAIPSSHLLETRLLWATNRRARVGLYDWLRIACDDTLLCELNPYLSSTARRQYQSATRVYLALTVLQSRCARILHIAKKGAKAQAQLVRELECRRAWSIDDHPHWLVFEVEQGLQIRPEQYAIVRHLLDAPPGAISQLNMGLGKTRVILPMLILHYALQQGRTLPRVHVLTSILHEAIDVLHLRLTASSLGVVLIEQPFHRQIDLTPARVQVLRQQCLASRACYIVAPEHRLSLEMKVKEWMYQDEDALAKPLAELLEHQSFVDLFDECDALFHHRYQLVYAVGSPAPLSQCDIRATTAQALLCLLNATTDSPVDKWLQQHGTTVAVPSACMFRRIRLRDDPSDTRHAFRVALLNTLVASPPLEFKWLQSFLATTDAATRDACVAAIVDKAAPVTRFESLPDVQFKYLLTLRGYLGFGLLEHALEQRHRVDYGLDTGREKRVAVPFRAADVPSDRAEFGHPDIGMLLTTLAYYYQGLSSSQVLEAIHVLLSLGLPAQIRIYDAVVASLHAELSAAERDTMGHVSKLDPTNTTQMDLVVSKLAHSMELINFWLQRCVLDTDLAQFPARIATSAWDLAQSTHAKGFSGTNDTNAILPLQITPMDPSIPSILGTNGRMVAQLLAHTQSAHFLPPHNTQPLWQSLVEFAMRANHDALIDTGSLLAGVSNRAIASFMATHAALAPKFRAVVYFCPAAHQWLALNRHTRQTLELHVSPIKERDAFVLFDDARSRGTDMQLRPTAVATLTLGPKLTKDKLMQGAGRLRLLGHHQKLVLVAPAELESALATPLTIEATLQWIVRNTVASIQKGLPTWSQQGLFFHESREVQHSGVVDEHWDVVDLFGPPIAVQSLANAVRSQCLNNTSTDLMLAIDARCQDLGQEIQVSLQYNEECERELQLDEEEEIEEETALAEMNALDEAPWEYAAALTAKSVADLVKAVQLVPMTHVKQLATELVHVAWPSLLFGTVNFFATVTSPALDFSRLADAVLVLPSQEWVILSDREADAILGLLWRSPTTPLVRLDHLSTLRRAQPFQVNEQHVASLQLYNGETMFPTPYRQSAIQKLVANQKCRDVVRNLLVARGEKRNWDCSDLQRICDYSTDSPAGIPAVCSGFNTLTVA
ncbi:Aste57867_5643 [Aphanomyces stellatus]|uniref:ubiquitinyl hydrolase 1 n=1 Tax=Aphanomyces stellatus TaxID=120398 RepID=A0A485KD64_9STRA|nr:hypothetical protein As57867_005630 [Aphanomyces stellatus]VFT82689.1 Aste57867_5643 [Aphanomyces stellatus]